MEAPQDAINQFKPIATDFLEFFNKTLSEHPAPELNSSKITL
jgi:hypothetical protein